MTIGAQHQYEISFNTIGGKLDSMQTRLKAFKFWSPQLFDLNRRIRTKDVPFSHISALQGDKMRGPEKMTFYGLKYSGSVHEVLTRLKELQNYLSGYSADEYYVQIEFYSSIGGTLTLRRFGEIREISAEPAKGAQYTAWQPRIRWVSHDPFWYDEDSPRVEDATMTNGNLTYCSAHANQYWPSQRWKSQIKVNLDGHVIKNPRVESAYDSDKYYQITGELSDIDDYWEVDHLKGTVIEHDASAGLSTNAIGKFSGHFWALGSGDVPLTENIKITSDPSGDSDLLFTATMWEIW